MEGRGNALAKYLQMGNLREGVAATLVLIRETSGT